MRTGSLLLRPSPPPLSLGIAVAALLVAVETLLVYPLSRLAPGGSLSVIYLLGVLVVATVWGLWLAAATSVASVLVANFFNVPPAGFAFDIRDLVKSAIFLIVALLTSSLANLARSRAAESDLAAEMAHILLYTDDLHSALPAVAAHLARKLDLPAATIELDAVAGDERHMVFPLRDGATSLGTLLVPANLPVRARRRLQERVVPSLESLLPAARERTAMRRSLESSREELRLLADEQAALRRVATLVARDVPAPRVFDAVTTELARLMGAYHAWLVRYEPDGTATVVSTNQPGATADQRRLPVEGDNVVALVRSTGHAARMDSYEGATGRVAAIARELGVRSVAGVPIIVEGRLWGAAGVSSPRPGPLPPDTETRIMDFTELAATSIANADSRDKLIASRARIAAAADEARRRIERDLHDGAQQQLVALALESRATAARVPAELDELKQQMSHTVSGLIAALDNLREISRGIHPAVLSTGGLRPALKALARRCPIPVTLDTCTSRRLPERIEVAAYYVVSEAITNTVRHAHASMVRVDAEAKDGTLRLSIRDDGVGGADPTRGSGLIGLRDRVEAVGGQMEITSPAGAGTQLLVKIPIEPG